MVTAKQQRQCQSDHYYVGATIEGRYTLTDFIGAGGMACVYRAREIGTPHEFAFKFLKDQFRQAEFNHLVEYFEEEATSMRNLAHPNIVRFYRFVNRSNYSYIIMDYVDGFALSEVLKLARDKNTAMPLDEVVRVMVQIARALDTIHRDSFVHRDIKPSNVLIDRKTGKAFLTDLGIASAQGTKIEGAGTIAYMSPEQAATWKADQRSDIYAYGILLFEMLTGKRPFSPAPGLSPNQAEADLLRKHKEKPVPSVTDVRSDLPKALNDIIKKAMAKDPDDRYQTVIEFARDVHAALRPKLSADLQDFASIQHQQIAAPATVAPPQPDSQNLVRLLMVIGAAAIIIGGLLIFSILASDDEPPITTPTAEPNLIDQVENRYPFLVGLAALAEPDDATDLIIQPNQIEDEPLNYLRVEFINGFEVTIDIASTDAVRRYGVAYRVQDAANYLAFTLNPATGSWQIIEVVEGVTTVQRSGSTFADVTLISVAGIDNFFEITLNDETITYETDRFSQGSLALYVDEGTLTLETLTVSILGEEARTYADLQPTPSSGLANPLRFILADIEAMQETNLTDATAVNCPAYIDVYESLSRHNTSDNEDVRQAATLAQRFGMDIYERCTINQPDGVLDFTGSIGTYSTWESALEQLQIDLITADS